MHKRKNNLLSEIKATLSWYLYFDAIELMDKLVALVVIRKTRRPR